MLPELSTVQCCTAQYNTVQYSIEKYSIVQYNTVQYSIGRYRTIHYSTVKAIQYNTIRCNTIQYNAMQYSTNQTKYKYIRSTQYINKINTVHTSPGIRQSPHISKSCYHHGPVHVITRPTPLRYVLKHTKYVIEFIFS